MAGLTRRAALRSLLALAGVPPLVSSLAACGLVTPAHDGGGGALTLLGGDDNGTDLSRAMQLIADGESAASGGGTRVVVRVAQPTLVAAVGDLLQGVAGAAADTLLVTPAVRDTPGAPTLMINLGAGLVGGLTADVYPQLLRYGAAGPRQYVAPMFRDPLVVFCNLDAFARAGVDRPAPNWTLNRFMAVCAALAAASGPAAPLASATGQLDLELVSAFVVGFNGQLLDALPGGNGYAPLFAEPAALEGLSALLQLQPYEPAQPATDPRALFASGGAAMFFGHHCDVRPLADAIGDHFAWDVAALPVFPYGVVQPVRADGLAAISSNPDSREGAIALALYALTYEAQAALMHLALGVPVLRALAGSPLWRQAAPQINNDVFVSNADHDMIVDLPLLTIAPTLALALAAVLRGAPLATAFQTASTAVQFQLATWQPT